MPLCIDLFCGLGGWSEGFLSEGWDVVGFDIERHVYGEDRYPAQLVIQDVRTLDGRQFRNADCIVASPPCQEYSYMAMPWSRAKQIAGALREEVSFPEGYTGSRTVADLTSLFDACFRIQREAIEATQNVCPACAGSKLDGDYTCCGCGGLGWTERRYIPMVVENVKGAQPWVGKAKANFGSFYFWGDVAMVGGQVVAGRPQFGQTVKAARRGMKRNPDGTEHPQGSWFAIADSKERGANGQKQAGRNFHFPEKYGIPSPSFNGAEHEESVAAALALAGVKQGGTGDAWFDGPVDERRREAAVAIKSYGGDFGWDGSQMRQGNSHSPARKAASAQIAKIPFPLASYIARSFKPATK